LVDNTHGSPSQLGQDLVATKTFAPAIIHKVLCAVSGFQHFRASVCPKSN
jgi:hypothetical protein